MFCEESFTDTKFIKVLKVKIIKSCNDRTPKSFKQEVTVATSNEFYDSRNTLMYSDDSDARMGPCLPHGCPW